MVGNLNMTEFGARCIIFILFYVTGGHVVPASTVVRYIRQKLLFFMETTQDCPRRSSDLVGSPDSLLHARNGQRLR